MEQVSIDDLDPEPSTVTAATRRLGAALGTTDVAINHYTVESGERVSGLHAHGDQEELFFVLAGEATIETLDGAVTLAEREAVRVAPGEFQSVTNDAAEPLEVLAIGAPLDSEDLRIPLPCPECDHEFRRPVLAGDGPVLVCPDCGDETPATCPDCGSEAVHAVLGEDGDPVSLCRGCGTTTAP